MCLHLSSLLYHFSDSVKMKIYQEEKSKLFTTAILPTLDTCKLLELCEVLMAPVATRWQRS